MLHRLQELLSFVRGRRFHWGYLNRSGFVAEMVSQAWYPVSPQVEQGLALQSPPG